MKPSRVIDAMNDGADKLEKSLKKYKTRLDKLKKL
jgi:ribosome-associated translation inhibitor RaiA